MGKLAAFGASWAAVMAVVTVTWGASTGIYDGRTIRPATLEQVLQRVRPGTIVVIGEQHDDREQHENELTVLQTLARVNVRVSAGFEFLAYPDQPFVDRYVRGDMVESEFLAAVHWGGTPFPWYRPLILFPRGAGGDAVALNAPEALTRTIAQKGLDALTDEERSLLPPGFALGNALYYERFAREVQQHGSLSDAAVRNFFAAQSVWDDTMAWRALIYLAAHAEQVLLIIVGDFHVAYGGGLPDRLRARGASDVVVISQVDSSNMSESEIGDVLAPNPKYGLRADFIWLTGP